MVGHLQAGLGLRVQENCLPNRSGTEEKGPGRVSTINMSSVSREIHVEGGGSVIRSILPFLSRSLLGRHYMTLPIGRIYQTMEKGRYRPWN